MQYFALFIGNFSTYSITFNAYDIECAVSHLEELYSFTQGPMRVEIYNSNKKHIETLYPFKIEGYTEKCPCGKNPHFCDFKADPWDKHWEENYDDELYEKTRLRNEKIKKEYIYDGIDYYDDEQMQEIKENKERFDIYHRDCPYRKVYECQRRAWDEDDEDATEDVVMYAECCLPQKTSYIFAPSFKSAKKRDFFEYKYPVVITTKI